MFNQLLTFFDHSRHKLTVHGIDASLDVLAFQGEEHLSQPFNYCIEFTCTEHDIAAKQMLGREASFSLHSLPLKYPKLSYNLTPLPVPPLRTLYGVVTGFKRLSGSNDEACYEITLEPRLALLDRGKQFRIYQHQSVPEIVESILRSRHEFLGQHFRFKLHREYPRREQVMQYGVSDLVFIARLLAEVGIWYRFFSDDRLRLSRVEFHDDQRSYLRPRVELPYRPPSGLSSSEQDGVWKLQTGHQVVEKNINFRAYDHLNAKAGSTVRWTRPVVTKPPTVRPTTTPNPIPCSATATSKTKTWKVKAATFMPACATSVTSMARPGSAVSAAAPTWPWVRCSTSLAVRHRPLPPAR